MPETYRAARFAEFGPPEDMLHMADLPLPAPGPGEALVRIEAAAINPSDVKNVQGAMRAHTSLPRTPGRDFAGIVTAGPDEFIGAPVWGTGGDLGFVREGAHAGYLLLPTAALSRRPANLAPADAAAVGTPYITAWIGLVERAKMQAGETVLVVGYGAVGSAVAQIAKWRGASRVLATVRFASEPGRAGGRGALPGVDEVIDLGHDTLDHQIRNVTGGRGVDIVYNTVGGATFAPSLAALVPGGRMAVIAATADPNVTFGLLDFYRRDLNLLGVNTLHQSATECAAILNQLSPGFVSGALTPPGPLRTMSLEQAASAYEHLAAGGKEKIVLVP